jgi:hypothetical protein
MPAQLSRMSARWPSAKILAKFSRRAVEEETSQVYFVRVRPVLAMEDVSVEEAGSLGSSMEMMLAPPSARARVMALPRPPVEPVTIAVRPSREKREEMMGGVDMVCEGRSCWGFCVREPGDNVAVYGDLVVLTAFPENTRRIVVIQRTFDENYSHTPPLRGAAYTMRGDMSLGSEWNELSSFELVCLSVNWSWILSSVLNSNDILLGLHVNSQPGEKLNPQGGRQ